MSKTTIYFADVTPLREQRFFDALLSAASKERRQRIGRLRFQGDQLRSLGVESLLLHALSDAGFSRDALALAYGPNGKPYLPKADGFFFNASHDGVYAMLAVSDAEIGCDIEQIEPVRDRLAARVLTPGEYAAFLACDLDRRDELFFRYWVSKESCMKLTGEGLKADPASYEIVFGSPTRVYRNGVQQPFALFESGEISGYRYAVSGAGDLSVVQPKLVSLAELAETLRQH